MNRNSLTVAEAVASAAVEAGIDTVFGVGGTHTLPLLAALRRTGITYVGARSELGAGYMAVGFARVSRRPAIVLTSTGPGALSVIPALQDAEWSSLPLVHLTTAIGGAGFSGLVHETPCQHEVLRLASKSAVTVAVATAAADVGGAIMLSMSGRRGPVTIEVPVDMWTQTTAPMSTTAATWSAPLAGDVEVLAEALAGARRPLLFVGGGAVRRDGGAAALELASRIGAPVLTSHPGKTVSNWDNQAYIGPWATEAGVRTAIEAADVAVVLGSKLSALGSAMGQLPLPKSVFRITLDDRSHVHYPHIRTVIGDAALTAEKLAGEVRPQAPWLDVATIVDRVVSRKRSEHPGEMDFVGALGRRSGGNRLFSGDMCKAAFWAMKYLPSEPEAIHAFSGYMAMGTGLPAAIGMATAAREPVLALVGDGGLQMSLAEVATMAETGLPITMIVVVDGAYGILRDNAQARSQPLGVDLWNPDIERLLSAYGLPVTVVKSSSELYVALQHDAEGPRAVVTTQSFSRLW